MYRNYLIASHQELIDISFLEENGSRSQQIPAFDATLQELVSAGWTISEYRKVMRGFRDKSLAWLSRTVLGDVTSNSLE